LSVAELTRVTISIKAAESGGLTIYDTASRVTQLTDLGGTHAYGYDSVDRLTSATYPGATAESYTYDGVGNRTASHLSASYSYQGFNEVTGAGGATYNYDNNGNLLTKVAGTDTTQYAWDFENRLTQVTLPSGTVLNYKYDALGRRVQRTTTSGADERYVYDGQNVVQDLDSNSSVVTSYLNGPGFDNHLRQTNATTGVSYFLTDHLGSTIGLTDSNANVVEQISHDSFGNHLPGSRTRYTHTGRERDPDTGLMYYRARFYDPQLGRFVSEDPTGFSGGSNWFSYALNNPLRFVDPLGLQGDDPGFWSLQGSYWLGVGEGVGQGLIGTVALAGGLITHPVNTTKTIGSDLSMRAETMYDGILHPMELKEAITDAILTVGPDGAMNIVGNAGGQVIAVKGMSEVAAFARLKIISNLPDAAGTPPGGIVADILDWLGPGARRRLGNHGEPFYISADGLRKMRVDFQYTSPHSSPHLHFEECVNGKRVKSGPIYPKDVPHN
jgi:RHS repeat-associated protein